MKKKRICREIIHLELGRNNPTLIRVNGPHPYIAVTTDSATASGCVPDRSIKKLKRWCEEILETRKK